MKILKKNPSSVNSVLPIGSGSHLSFLQEQAWVREFGMDMYTLLYLKWITQSYYVTQGTLLNVIWQPGWEGSLGENGYMCTYG